MVPCCYSYYHRYSIVGYPWMATTSIYSRTLDLAERLRSLLEAHGTADVNRSQALDYAATLAVVMAESRVRDGLAPFPIASLRESLEALDAKPDKSGPPKQAAHVDTYSARRNPGDGTT